LLFIGEALNATRKRVAEAVLAHDEEFIAGLAQAQVESGANYLDVNAAASNNDEVSDLVWMVKVVQGVVDVPLCIDSASPKAIQAACEVHRGVPMINSISGEPMKFNALLPLVTKVKGKVIALCIGETGIPKTAQGRLEVARGLVERLEGAGVEREDIYVDPIVLSVATEHGAATVTLETITLIKRDLPGVNTILAVSNVGFGIPERALLNNAMATLALHAGIDAFLADVRGKGLIAHAMAAKLLLGQDPFCGKYLKTYRAGKLM
jgi:5-methyltetrahydrofolate--homocysteine methyltransferase